MSYLKDSTGHIQLALILCVLFNSFIASAFAAEKLDDAIDDPFFINDVPIVLSATRLAQPQTEAPAAVTIIDRELIKLSGAKSIAEIFRLVPGMHVGYYRGNRAVVGYQGLSSEYPQGVQVLIDGRSVYSPLFGGVDWSNIPLVMEDIERIEVIRGPNGSSFGSNAFQSVINITTSHAVQLNGLQLKTTVGERGYQRTLLRASDSIGDLDYRISASHIDDNGYRNNDDDSRQDLFSARVDYQLTAKDSLQLNFGAVNTLNQTRNPDEEVDPFDPLRQVDESNYSLHGKWEHSTNDRQHFITQASYTRHLSKDKVSSVFNVDGFGDVVFNGDYTAYYDRYDVEFEHQLQPLDQLRVSWGLGSRNDRVMQPIWMGSTKKFDNSIQRVFSNVEWRPSTTFIVNAGALWEHSQLSGDHLSPRLAVNYLLTPEHSFRLIRSRAIRAPVLVEENFTADVVLETVPPGTVLTIPYLRSEGGLDPETVDSYEVGYHGLFINKTLTLDLKLFRNEYDKLIDTSNVYTPIYLSSVEGEPLGAIDAGNKFKIFSNLRYANVNGYEIEINYRPDKKNLLHVGYAYNHTDVGKLSNNDIKNILSSVPDDVFNILASHTFDNKIWLSSAFYYTGSMEYLDSGNPQGPMRRLDINAGKSFKVAAKQSLDISVGLQLALDKNIDFLKQFNLDNRAFIEASYTFE
jgi:iron complex outermembrane receptor protein